jgi:ubiquinone/menaquinone biosynthesis C-methylase UbiE
LARDIDILTAPVLKHLRDRWWDAAFTEFVRDTLHPRSGDRILELGCSGGLAELTLGLLEPGDVRYVGIDRRRDRLRHARGAARDHALSLGLAAAEAGRLPFREAAFDSAFGVGVLQYACDPQAPLRELARVTRRDGRVLLVEPDNAARYWYSSLPSGMRTFALSQEFFQAQRELEREAKAAKAENETEDERPGPDLALGPHLPELCRANGIDPIAVHLFPVATTRLGAPVPSVWEARRQAIARLVADAAPNASIRSIGEDLLRALGQYAEESAHAGPAFLEIQHTMLFATVGHVRA